MFTRPSDTLCDSALRRHKLLFRTNLSHGSKRVRDGPGRACTRTNSMQRHNLVPRRDSAGKWDQLDTYRRNNIAGSCNATYAAAHLRQKNGVHVGLFHLKPTWFLDLHSRHHSQRTFALYYINALTQLRHVPEVNFRRQWQLSLVLCILQT